MVSVIAFHDPFQPRSGQRHRFMHLSAQLLLNLLKLCLHTLRRRPSPDNIVTRGVCPTVVSKTQERERLWFSLSTLLPVGLGKTSKLNQPRLLRMKFQSEFGQPFLKLSQEPLGFLPMCLGIAVGPADLSTASIIDQLRAAYEAGHGVRLDQRHAG